LLASTAFANFAINPIIKWRESSFERNGRCILNSPPPPTPIHLSLAEVWREVLQSPVRQRHTRIRIGESFINWPTEPSADIATNYTLCTVAAIGVPTYRSACKLCCRFVTIRIIREIINFERKRTRKK
jgi:hypothetical protein